jgi:hypothetical protein
MGWEMGIRSVLSGSSVVDMASGLRLIVRGLRRVELGLTGEMGVELIEEWMGEEAGHIRQGRSRSVWG